MANQYGDNMGQAPAVAPTRGRGRPRGSGSKQRIATQPAANRPLKSGARRSSGSNARPAGGALTGSGRQGINIATKQTGNALLLTVNWQGRQHQFTIA